MLFESVETALWQVSSSRRKENPRVLNYAEIMDKYLGPVAL